MNRRGFLGALIAVPFAAKAATLIPATASRATPFVPPTPAMGRIMMAGPLYCVQTLESDFERYYRTYAVAIRRGPTNVTQVWRDGILMIDTSDPFVVGPRDRPFPKIVIYPGDELQLPDPSLEDLPLDHGGGVGNVPSFRGLSYAVVTHDDLTDTRGCIPVWSFA